MSTNIDKWPDKNISFFTKIYNEIRDFHKEIENSLNNPEITKREWRLAYCRVLRWDTIPKIRNRLSKYPEFDYLKESRYQNKILWFNIKDSDLRPWMNLMVPLKIEKREIGDSDFINKSKIAINQMMNNPIYWNQVKTLVQKIWKDNLARVMYAFAKVETANGNPEVKIWNWCLYRYEKTDLYSVSYYHIIPRHNRAWGIALQKLKMTVWDTCDPINAWKLFLWFWCQAVPDTTKLETYLNPKKAWRFNKAAKIYNSWSSSYPNLLSTSYNHARNIG